MRPVSLLPRGAPLYVDRIAKTPAQLAFQTGRAGPFKGTTIAVWATRRAGFNREPGSTASIADAPPRRRVAADR